MGLMPVRSNDARRQRLLPLVSALLLVGSVGIALAVDVHRRNALLAGLADPIRFGPLEVRPPQGWSVRRTGGGWMLPWQDSDALQFTEPTLGSRPPRTMTVQVQQVRAGASPESLLDQIAVPGNLLLEERWRSVPLAGGGGYLLSFTTPGPRPSQLRKFVLVAGIVENRLGVTLTLQGDGRANDDDIDLLVRVAGALSLAPAGR